MAELFIIGQLVKAIDFEIPRIICKWSVHFGTNWRHIEGFLEGQTAVCSSIDESNVYISHPIDIHLACKGVVGWPKIHVEVYAVNAINFCFPIGFGVAHIPTKKGTHLIEIPTWSITPTGFWQSIKNKFWSSGVVVGKADLIYSGADRYQLSTNSSGTIQLELTIVHKNFSKSGIAN